MLFSRRLLLGLPLSLVALRHTALAADPAAAPVAVIERFYAVLLAVMKEAKRLPFDERYNRLAPTIGQTFELGLMTRVAVGPSWAQIAPEQQQRLTTAFSRYTISVYASRFDDWGGEKFEVLGTTPNPNGIIVNTSLVKANGEKISLNYLMRQETNGAWEVIDVYLSGTVSELATRRSEFVTVLQKSGADGLAQLIEQRTATLRAGST
jgi:phospholipid transport system substrate-binding protein